MWPATCCVVSWDFLESLNLDKLSFLGPALVYSCFTSECTSFYANQKHIIFSCTSLPKKLYLFVKGSTDGGIHMSGVVCES